MSQLDDDIARIAALRGRPVNYYTDRQPVRAHPTPDQIGQIFHPSPDWDRDLRVYDRLPPRSRGYISDAVLPLNAQWWASLLSAFGDEEEIISQVETQTTGRRRDWIRKHYGPGHPGLRRLG